MLVDKAQVVEILRARGDQDLADQVNVELPSSFDPQQVELLRGVALPIDQGDAARHSGAGAAEDMSGLPQEGRPRS